MTPLGKALLIAAFAVGSCCSGEFFDAEPALLIRRDSSEPGKLLPPTPIPYRPAPMGKAVDSLQAGGVTQGVFWKKVEGMVDEFGNQSETRNPATEAPNPLTPPPLRPDGETR